MSTNISDSDGIKGELGSTDNYRFIYDVAENQDLVYLKNFFDNGFSVDLRQVVNELESVEWPTVEGMSEVIASVVKVLLQCNGIVFLTE